MYGLAPGRWICESVGASRMLAYSPGKTYLSGEPTIWIGQLHDAPGHSRCMIEKWIWIIAFWNRANSRTSGLTRTGEATLSTSAAAQPHRERWGLPQVSGTDSRVARSPLGSLRICLSVACVPESRIAAVTRGERGIDDIFQTITWFEWHRWYGCPQMTVNHP